MMSKAVFAACALVATADVYMHFPRGANCGRCDEKSNNRDNANLNCNSQNNAAGGYGICDKEMYFYEGTDLKVEFYSQHSCGNGDMNKNDPLNFESTICQHTLQLGCENTFNDPIFLGDPAIYGNPMFTDGISLGRPGADKESELTDNPDEIYETFGDTCTERPPRWEECADRTESEIAATEDQCNALTLQNGGDRSTFNSDTCKCSTRKRKTHRFHETNYYWDLCASRSRQKGLFTADQNPRPYATASRQQPQSQRYGFECPEERDYYPYWAPVPFVDLAVFVSNTSRCDTIRQHSFNVEEKCWCMPDLDDPTLDDIKEAHFHITRPDCQDAGHSWQCVAPWNTKMNVGEPYCGIAPDQPDNRLGNTNVKGVFDLNNDDTFAHYKWSIPYNFVPEGETGLRCTIRLRYNISTGETPEEFDSSKDYLLKGNPVVTYGDAYDMEAETPQALDTVMPVRMAINTAQYGRTFEDRSYIFEIRKRPSSLQGVKIHNLNVRGKRGNIAQVRNCVEYDFVPLELQASVGDVVHFQWCGTEYNNNGNAGEGRQGTDRSNVIEIGDYNANMPKSLNMSDQIFSVEDLRMLAWLNQTECYSIEEMLGSKKNSGNDVKSCHFLNGVRDADNKPTAYFNLEARIERNGNFRYMSSRNNNFSNRSQKATIAVGTTSLSTGAIAGIAVGVLVVLGLVGAGAALLATGKISLGKSSRV